MFPSEENREIAATEGHRAQFHRIWVPRAHMATDTLPADRMGPHPAFREAGVHGVRVVPYILRGQHSGPQYSKQHTLGSWERRSRCHGESGVFEKKVGPGKEGTITSSLTVRLVVADLW